MLKPNLINSQMLYPSSGRLIILIVGILLFLYACGSGGSDNTSSENPDSSISDAGQPQDQPETTQPEKVSIISIELEPDDWNQIRHTGRSTYTLLPVCGASTIESPYTYVRAKVTVDGSTLENVGLRVKGLLGSINPERPSLKMKFDEFVKDQTMAGLKRMTLNNNNQDGSRLRTYLAYKMFQKAGLPAPDCSFAHVTVNGKDLGIYSNVEPIKKPFLRKWFSDDEGNLYEAQLSDFRPDLINSWERKNNDDTAEDSSDLEAVMTALETDDAGLIDALAAVLDMDAFFKFWAMEIITDHWDGHSGNLNNCYLYNDPGSDKFTFIPWGTDTVFSDSPEMLEIKSVGPLRANSLLTKRLYDNPQGRQMLLNRVKELYQVIWGNDDYLKKVRELEELIKPYVAQAINADFENQVDALYGYMQKHSQDLNQYFISSQADLDLPAQYPYEPVERCYSALPETEPISFTFTTTWGTMPAPGTGTVTEVDIPDMTPDAYSVAVNTSLGASPGMVSIVLAGFNFGNTQVEGISLSLSPYQLTSGEPIHFNNLANLAMAYKMPSYMDPMNIMFTGFVVEGELILTEAGMDTNDIVSGTFTGDIIYETPF